MRIDKEHYLRSKSRAKRLRTHKTVSGRWDAVTLIRAISDMSVHVSLSLCGNEEGVALAANLGLDVPPCDSGFVETMRCPRALLTRYLQIFLPH